MRDRGAYIKVRMVEATSVMVALIEHAEKYHSSNNTWPTGATWIHDYVSDATYFYFVYDGTYNISAVGNGTDSRLTEKSVLAYNLQTRTWGATKDMLDVAPDLSKDITEDQLKKLAELIEIQNKN